MSSPLQSRISETAFDAAVGTMFGLTIIAATIRTIIRVRRFHTLAADDWALFFGVFLLIPGTALLVNAVQGNYKQEKTAIDPNVNPVDLLKSAVHGTQLVLAADVMLWTTVYSIKFSFLLFFRQLVDRLHGLTIWWWVVFSLLLPMGILNATTNFIVCPHLDIYHIEQCFMLEAQRASFALTIYSTVSDVVTDLLLISIPLSVLYRSKLKPRQKYGLGVMFCLSVFMIVMSLIRGTDQKNSAGSVDLLWLLFWLQMEACVAVIMVSLTAFRTLFTADQSKVSRETPDRESPRYVGKGPDGWQQGRPGKGKSRSGKSSEPGIDTLIGMRSIVTDTHDDRDVMDSYNTGFTMPLEGPGIARSEQDEKSVGNRPSQESFV